MLNRIGWIDNHVMALMREGVGHSQRSCHLSHCSHAIVAAYDVLQDSIERFVDHKANSRSAVALRVPPLPFRLRRRTDVF